MRKFQLFWQILSYATRSFLKSHIRCLRRRPVYPVAVQQLLDSHNLYSGMLAPDGLVKAI